MHTRKVTEQPMVFQFWEEHLGGVKMIYGVLLCPGGGPDMVSICSAFVSVNQG